MEEREHKLLCSNLADTSISPAADHYVLEGREAQWLISYCVNNKYEECKKILDVAKQPETLTRGRQPYTSKTALSLACEEGI